MENNNSFKNINSEIGEEVLAGSIRSQGIIQPSINLMNMSQIDGKVIKKVNFEDILVDSNIGLSNTTTFDQQRLEEDIVIQQDLNPEKLLSKYKNIDLSEIFTLTMDAIKNPVKLCKYDQELAVKLSLNETKIDEMEAKFLEEDDEGEQASIDVFCVIDKSGSMRGSKLENVKLSLHYLLDLLQPEDRISIVTFDSCSELILAPKQIGKSRQAIEDAINSIQAGTATNIKSGLEKAFNTMLARKSKNQVTGVLLLTDGVDNKYFRSGGKTVDDFFAKYKKCFKNDEYTLHTFGYGDDHDEDLLEQIASKGKGKFYYINDIELVSNNFADCLAGLTSIVGINAYVDLFL